MLQNNKDALSVSDFKKLVKDLNSQNADESTVETDDNGERDMSNWTG